ncbi:MAG TPA: hypothetical protein PKD55_17130, partial [Bellilinea sp.]|nr:hypothetical protein [Bellilinea sp.]
MKKFWLIASVLVVLAMMVSACQPAPATEAPKPAEPQAPAATEAAYPAAPAATEPAAPAATKPA